MTRLSSRSIGFLLILAILAMLTQLFLFVALNSSRAMSIGYAVSMFVSILLILMLRQGKIKPGRLAFALFTVATVAGGVDVAIGRSPVTPYIVWYPVLVFMSITLCGARWGFPLAIVIILYSVFHLKYTLSLPDHFEVSAGVSLKAYTIRLEGAILLVFIITCILANFYLLLFDETLKELDAIEAGRSHRKRLSALACFGYGVAKEVEKPLSRMERLSDSIRLRRNEDIQETIAAVQTEIAHMSAITRRYLILSHKQGEDKEPVAIDQFLSFIQKFHEITESSAGLQLEVAPAAGRYSLPFVVARILILILCPLIQMILEMRLGDWLKLVINAEDDILTFTLSYESQMGSSSGRAVFEKVTDFIPTLWSVGGRMEMKFDGNSNQLMIHIPATSPLKKGVPDQG